MPDDNDDKGFDPAMFEQFSSFLDQRDEAKRKEAERRKPPKDFGEFIDRLSDAVLDKAEERAATRRKAAEEEETDDAPSRGEGLGWADKWFGKSEAS